VWPAAPPAPAPSSPTAASHSPRVAGLDALALMTRSSATKSKRFGFFHPLRSASASHASARATTTSFDAPLALVPL
jgi:hypothetical protein